MLVTSSELPLTHLGRMCHPAVLSRISSASLCVCVCVCVLSVRAHSILMSVCMCVQSVAMLRNITTFHNLATQAVERTASGGAEGHKITYNVIKQRLGDLLYKITSQKFEDPADGEEAVK